MATQQFETFSFYINQLANQNPVSPHHVLVSLCNWLIIKIIQHSTFWKIFPKIYDFLWAASLSETISVLFRCLKMKECTFSWSKWLFNFFSNNEFSKQIALNFKLSWSTKEIYLGIFVSWIVKHRNICIFCLVTRVLIKLINCVVPANYIAILSSSSFSVVNCYY